MIETFEHIENDARIEQKHYVENLLRHKKFSSLSNIATKAGFSHSLLLRWRNGEVICLSAATIDKIRKAEKKLDSLTPNDNKIEQKKNIDNNEGGDMKAEIMNIDEYKRGGNIQIPAWDLKLSAGTGNMQFEIAPTGYQSLMPQMLKNIHYSHLQNLAFLYVEGDSMAPKIQDGDQVLIDRGINRFVDGKIYAISYNDVFLIKRIFYDPVNKTVDLMSDNEKAKSYKGLDENSIKIEGIVVWTGQPER